MKNVSVNLPDKLAAIFYGKADYRGAYGGRGAAKTIGFANMAIVDIMRLSDRPWKFLCGRELQKSLKDSVFSVIASQIEVLGVQDAFEVGKEFIRCKNGNEFLFYGLKSNIAEVKGLHGVRRTWLEEAQKVSQSSLTYLIPTVMRDFPDCELWASWNPDDEDDPIHKMFVQDADPTFKCVKINYYDNPWFPQSLDKVRLRDLKNNPQRYDWIWEGNFNTNSDSAVYGKWIADMERACRVKAGIYDPDLMVYTAWDLGFSDDTAIWWFQVVQGEVRLIRYYENNREGLKHYAEQIYGREIINIVYDENGKVKSYKLGNKLDDRPDYKYADHYVPHDAANKLLQAGGRSVVNQLHELGIKTRVVAATSQQNQIAAARSTLEKTWADPETCKDGIRALRKYQFLYDEDRAKYMDKPDHDSFSHGCFVGSSEVLTRLGVCSIKNLPQSGEILTKCGWKQYINPRVTRTNAPLVEVVFKGGYTVKCTPDHLFLTERGWISAESLTQNTVIQSTLMRLPNILKVGFIGCGLAKSILRVVGQGFIGMFGNPHLGKSQMIATYTTRTEIQSITDWRIWNVCNQTNILDLLGKKQVGKGPLLGLQKKLEERPPSGINLQRVDYGINNMAIQKPCLSGLKKFVLNAQPRFMGLAGQIAAQIKNFALKFANHLLIESVTRLEERQDVWCLTVPDVSHFSLANGAVVHNCDAFEVIAQVWKSVTMHSVEKPRFLEDLTAKEVFWPQNTVSQGDNRI